MSHWRKKMMAEHPEAFKDSDSQDAMALRLALLERLADELRGRVQNLEDWHNLPLRKRFWKWLVG
jgi:hypothetical protein